MCKRWIFLAGLGVGLVMPAAASAQTSRPGEGPTMRPAMPGMPGMPPGGGMFGPGGRSFDGLEAVKTRLASSDEEWKVIGPKLRKVMAARQAAEAAIDPMVLGGVAAGGFSGPGGRGPGGGFRSPGGPGFGPDSFSGPGGGGPGGPGGPPGGFFPPGGPSSRPANDPMSMGGPGGGGPGWPGGGGPWPGATTRPATTRPVGGMFPQPGGFGPHASEGFGPRSSGGPGSPSLWGLVLSPVAGLGLPLVGGPSPFPGGFGPPPGGGFGPFPGGGPGPFSGGFGPPMGGGFGPPPGFGGPAGAPMQAMMDLLTATNDPKTTPEQLKEKLAAVRAARQKARADLAAAREDLLELLTSDQEAVLVDLGVLE